MSWQQMGAALFVALALHGGIAFWLTLPVVERLAEPPEPPLRVSLLAVVAESAAAPAPVTPPPPPKVKPPVPSKPKPEPAPKPKPEPVIQEPAPLIEPPPLVAPPEIVKAPAPTLEPSPAEPSPVPLDAVATAKYEQLLVAWLEKYKKYPHRAKRLRIEGEGKLRIRIDRTGQIQKITLEEPTGNRLLDKAALKMAERANPFPAMPQNDPRQTFEFIVPVVFALR